MSRLPYYQRYTADFIAATAHLTLEEVGAYDRLLDFQYQNGVGIASENGSVFRISGARTRREKRSVEKVVAEFFEARADDGGLLWNPRAYQEVMKRNRSLEKMSKGGTKGARKRWGTPSQPHADSDGVPHANPNGVSMASRARSDPDPYKQPGSGLPGSSPPRAGAREAGNATPCADGPRHSDTGAVCCCAAHMQAELEQNRQVAGVEPAGRDTSALP